MKQSLVVLLFIPLLVFSQERIQYNLSITKTGYFENKEVFIVPAVFTPQNAYNDGDFEVISMKANQKQFQLKGSLKYPIPISFNYIKSEGLVRQAAMTDFLFLDSGLFEIKLSDIETQDEIHNQVNSASNNEYEKLKSLYKFLEVDKSSIRKPNRENIEKKDKIIEAYVQQHPDSYVAMWVLINDYQLYGHSNKKGEITRLFSKEITATKPFQALVDKIEKGKLLTVNKKFPFPYFQFGENMAKAVTKSRYTFIDFWASSCKPCVAELPALKKIYAGNKLKGFDIYSVSIDNRLNLSIMNAIINRHGIRWTNVVDLGGVESIKLNISAIPRNFLVDSTGKIIATNISMLDLDILLKQVL